MSARNATGKSALSWTARGGDMPDYRVHIMTSVYAIDVTADDPDSARREAFEDLGFAWVRDVQAEGPDPWKIEVEELPEMPEEDK